MTAKIEGGKGLNCDGVHLINFRVNEEHSCTDYPYYIG